MESARGVVMRLSIAVLLALGFVVGCSSPDYGPPSGSTTVDLQVVDGFSLPMTNRHVRIEGTTATYSSGARTAHATIETTDVAAIIHELEDVEFLDLQPAYTTCAGEASDASLTTIEVSLSAGRNTVQHYQGCSGGIFDKLDHLAVRISELSGFTAWLAPE